MEIETSLNGSSFKFGIIVARFNELITQSLLSGAVNCLKRHGTKSENIIIIHVPGVFEIPFAVQKLLSAHKLDAIITLGAVIQGATSHHTHVAGPSCSQIQSIGLTNNTPVALGILTCETIEQALERAGTKCGNKGHDAAVAAIEMANLYIELENSTNRLSNLAEKATC